MWDWDGHMGGGWWIVMMIFWLAVLAVIMWGVIRATGAGGRARDDEPRPQRETPRDELDRRLARGEIGVEAYDALRERIERGSAGPTVPS